MTLLTVDQFQTHFQIKNSTLILSPQIAMIASLFNYNDFNYQSVHEIIEPVKKYSNVLIDVTDEDKFPGASFGHIQKWFKYAMKFVKKGGRLQAKFPPQLIPNLINQNLQINKIYLSSNECFVDIQNKSGKQTTMVSYSTGEVLDIDFNKKFILHHYNENDYNYLFNLKKTNKYKRITFSGSKVAEKIKTLKDNAEKECKYGLVVYSNIPKLRVEKLEQTNVSSGSDCYLFDTEKERDSYFQILHNPKVIALAKNLSYNQTINVKVQSYLINPSIFEYAS